MAKRQTIAGDLVTGDHERALEHCWRYFALHSQQRITVFNFFVAASGLTLSGLAYVLATPSTPKEFGVAAGIGAMLLALIFWKLDQRAAQLIKCSEQILIASERQTMSDRQQMFAQTEALPVNTSLLPFSGTWSYGRSFRFLFAGVAALGLLGAALNGYRNLLHSKSEPATKSLSRPHPASDRNPVESRRTQPLRQIRKGAAVIDTSEKPHADTTK
jgi:hypothetical protein